MSKLFCAHRGVSALMPENTLPAFAAALALGADEIEFDVRMTKDGKMVVSHDGTLERISNGTGHVADHTLDELLRLNIGLKHNWEVPFCTPDDVFSLLANKITFNIHIKEHGEDGALVKGLDVGDIVVAGDCVQYDVDTTALGDPPGFVSTVRKITFPCDRDAVRGILAAADRMRRKGRRVIEGRVATGDRFLTRAEEKQEIVREFGAFLCDQESCAIAQVCHVHGTPCAVIRAVSDASDGQHASEYENHAPLAAKNAAELAWKYLENLNGKS